MKKRTRQPVPAAPEERLIFYRDLREARRRKLGRRRRRILTAVFAVALALLVYINWDNFVPQETTEALQAFFTRSLADHFPVTLQSGQFCAAALVGNNIGVLTDTSYFLFSTAGTQLDWRQHGLNDPQLSAAGGKALLYERGGKQYRVEGRFSTTVSGTAAQAIVSGVMGASGRFALVTESGSYLGELLVFDAKGDTIFHWYDATDRILTAAISPDGNSVAAVEVGAKNGVVTSTVSVFRTGSTKPVARKEIDGTLLFSLQYASNARLVAVGDNQTVYFDEDGKQTGKYDYGNRQLSCYANENGSTVLAFESYESGSAASTLVPLVSGGNLPGTKSIGIADKITSLYAGTNGIAALSSGSVWLGTASGAKRALISAAGSKQAALAGKNAAYVFGLQTITRYAETAK